MKDKLFKNVDRTLLIVTIILVLFGVVFITSAGIPNGVKNHGDEYYQIKTHIPLLMVGIVAMLIGTKLSRRQLQFFGVIGFFLSLIAVALLFTSLGKTEHGQVRSILIPGINKGFQPSEFIKVSSIIFFASFLSQVRNRIDDSKIFIYALGVMGLSAGPILFKDFSTAAVIGATLFIMLFAAGMKNHQFVVMAALGCIVAVLFVTKYGYRMDRFKGFFSDEMNKETYHQFQSLYAMAVGGLFGVGLFHSRFKYNIFAAHSDFIIAVIAEEIGLFGVLIIIILFVVFIYRGYTISYRAENYFDKLVALGITSYIGVQALFNIAVACKFMPATGITLPFVSYGGTSIIVALGSVGILLGISKRG